MNSTQTNITEAVPPLPIGPAARAPELKLGRWVLVALAVVLLLAAAGLFPRWHARAALRAEAQGMSVPTVIVTLPVMGKASSTLTLPAEVRPLVEAPIYARANGFLKRWLVDLGARVEPGQLLAEIETPEVNQELARSRAELLQAEAALNLSRITATRWADLLKTSSVSEQEAAEKASDLALKSATVEAARANVRRLEELQSFARVTAPFAGTITARKTDVGELIAAGSAKELFRLAQTATLRVYTRVPQSAARSIVLGQAAELTIPELAGRIIPAHVVRTSGAMEAQSRTLLVELEVDNSAGEILAGSYAQVRFADVKREPILIIPSNALLFRAEGTQIGIVGADNIVELRSVTLGRDFGPTFEVLNGLSSQDRVIINPVDSLTAGTKVRMEESATPPSSPAPGLQHGKSK